MVDNVFKHYHNYACHTKFADAHIIMLLLVVSLVRPLFKEYVFPIILTHAITGYHWKLSLNK